MPLNFCLRCGAKFTGRGRLCPKCADVDEARRTRDRMLSEPWRMLYNRPEWAAAKIEVQRRDDGRCRALVNGQRCRSREDISVHHDPSLSELWAMVEGDLEQFMEVATDQAGLYCLCRRHHDERDRAQRERRQRSARAF